MANWFECKVRYDKMMENGVVKKVNEPYLVDALSFTEAESRIIEEQTPFISGDFSVSAVKRTKISEIFWDDSADKWYLVKVAYTYGRQRPQGGLRQFHGRYGRNHGRLRDSVDSRDSSDGCLQGQAR